MPGVYHLRVDIRDGVPAVPDEPDCTDAWFVHGIVSLRLRFPAMRSLDERK